MAVRGTGAFFPQTWPRGGLGRALVRMRTRNTTTSLLLARKQAEAGSGGVHVLVEHCFLATRKELVAGCCDIRSVEC